MLMAILDCVILKNGHELLLNKYMLQGGSTTANSQM